MARISRVTDTTRIHEAWVVQDLDNDCVVPSKWTPQIGRVIAETLLRLRHPAVSTGTILMSFVGSWQGVRTTWLAVACASLTAEGGLHAHSDRAGLVACRRFAQGLLLGFYG